jgi:hypothetical protein
MRFANGAIVTCALLVLAATADSARADCVDFSAQRAKAAGAALARNAPTPAQLGVPDLEGLELDAPRTTGDPKCDGPGPYKRFYYTSKLTFGDLVARWHPNIQARIEADGMKREWFRNPYHARGFNLTSGTRVEFVLDGTGPNSKLLLVHVMPAATLAPLTVSNQPYTVAEIVDWTPWPGGPKGPRQFVRADQGGASAPPAAAPAAPAAASAPGTGPAADAPAAAQPATAGAAATGTAQSAVNCPPRQAQGAAADGQRAGADVGGAVLGGGFGRSVGAALGGVLGSIAGGGQRPAADPNCP